MTNNQDQEGFLIPALTCASEYAKCISPMEWLGRINSRFKDPSARDTEKYVIVCLVIEGVICLMFWMRITDHLRFLGWLIVVLAILRIVEIIARTVGIKDVISPVRTLALGAINYFELALCFGAIYALNYRGLQWAGQPITGYYFSIITQLTIGYGDVYPKGWLRIVAALQGLAGTLFIISVFARAIAALPINEKRKSDGS